MGMEAGYTLKVKPSFPIYLSFRISAAAQMFSKPPPAHPAMIPWSTMNLPSTTLSRSVKSTAPSKDTAARFSTSARMSSRFASESLYESNATNGDAAVPGTDANDGNTYTTQDNAYSESSITDNDYNYLNDEKITTTQNNGGNIDYDNSSVSVVATRYVVYDQAAMEANGDLKDTTWDQFKLDNADPVKVTDVDQDFISMVATATGFDADNITFLVYEQAEFVDKSGMNISYSDIFQIALAVLIFALLAFVVFRSTRTAKEVEPEAELSVESLLDATSDEEALDDIGYAEKSETRILIEKFVDENPDAVALLLRNWLNEDWE